MCASVPYNTVGMTQLRIAYMYLYSLSLWNIANAGTLYKNTSRGRHRIL